MAKTNLFFWDCGSTTGSILVWIILSKMLRVTQRSEIGRLNFGSSAGLLGSEEQQWRHLARSLGAYTYEGMRKGSNIASQIDAALLWYITNSGRMLSQPCDLAAFSLLMAMASSLAVKSPDRLASPLSARESKETSHDIIRENVKSSSASGKCPFFRTCKAIPLADTGHLEQVVDLPVS